MSRDGSAYVGTECFGWKFTDWRAPHLRCECVKCGRTKHYRLDELARVNPPICKCGKTKKFSFADVKLDVEKDYLEHLAWEDELARDKQKS